MVVQNVPPALLVRFLREHRAEWADYGVDAYSAACLKTSPYAVPCARPSGFASNPVILPLAHTVEHEEVTNPSNIYVVLVKNCLVRLSRISFEEKQISKSKVPILLYWFSFQRKYFGGI